jgi:hypothetical protein
MIIEVIIVLALVAVVLEGVVAEAPSLKNKPLPRQSVFI